jgi:CYTH domain-containing protein
MMAEVEFPSEDEAMAFTAPEWFGEEVTLDKRYHNSEMTKSK